MLGNITNIVDPIRLIVTVISIGFAADSVTRLIYRKAREFKLRKIRSVLGIADGDSIVLVCSELDDPEERQMVEKREFIYHMKYGDLDAWIDALLSFMRLYPQSKIRLMSSREALTSIFKLDAHIVVIGGPDYNKIAEHFIEHGSSMISYDLADGEIALRVKGFPSPLYFTDDYHDFGYFERFPNPADAEKSILLFGGNHTLGVTGSVKLLSAFVSGSTGVSRRSLKTAAHIYDRFGTKENRFAFLIKSHRVGASIAQPGIEDIVWVDRDDGIVANPSLVQNSVADRGVQKASALEKDA